MVTLSIEEYNELRDFKIETERGLEEGKTAVLSSGRYGGLIYCTNDEIITRINMEKEELIKENKKLIEEVSVFSKDITMIKEMSYWGLIKWKFRLNNDI